MGYRYSATQVRIGSMRIVTAYNVSSFRDDDRECCRFHSQELYLATTVRVTRHAGVFRQVL